MTATVAVLGPGGVGGALAVRLARAGHRVICVARRPTAAAIAQRGLTAECEGQVLRADPEVAQRLDEAVDLLLVTVKAYDLDEALTCVDGAAVARGVAVPLLNGLEHMEALHSAFGPRAAAGSIGRIEAYRRDPVTIVQESASPVVKIGADELPDAMLGVVARLLRDAGTQVTVERSEKAVLWEKAVRLAPLAAVTSVTASTLGEVRGDPVQHDRLRIALEEACAVAFADGVAVSAAAQWELVQALPATLTTSAARDVAAGRPSELDAIVGSVARAAHRLGVPVPTLEALLEELAGA